MIDSPCRQAGSRFLKVYVFEKKKYGRYDHHLGTKVGIVAGMPVGSPVINEDESLWSVCGRVKCTQEVVDTGLVLRVLACHIIHQDLCTCNLVVPAKPEIGVAHVVAVEDLLCQVKVFLFSCGLVEPGSSPSELIIVATPGADRQSNKQYNKEACNYKIMLNLLVKLGSIPYRVGVLSLISVSKVKELTGIGKSFICQFSFPNIVVEDGGGSQGSSGLASKVRPWFTGTDGVHWPVHIHVLGTSPVVVVRVTAANLSDELIWQSVGVDEVIGGPLDGVLDVLHLTGILVALLEAYRSPSELGGHRSHGETKLQEVSS